MTQNTAPQASGNPRPALKAVLYAAILVGGIVAAWAAHERWVRPHGGGGSLPSGGTWRATRPAVESFPPASQPADLLRQSVSGMTPMVGDPGDIAAPVGASRRYACQGTMQNRLVQQAGYDLDGTIDQAAAHYLGILKARGFNLLGDRTEGAAKRVLVLSQAGTEVTLILRKNLTQAGPISIGLTVVRPGG